MQAAIGIEQLKKVPAFIECRRHNWERLYKALKTVENKIILPEPAKNSKPSWFGFSISIKPEMGRSRDKVISFLEKNNVQTRLLFSGNYIKHPCFDEIRRSNMYRVISPMKNTEYVMKNTFWIGVYPGLTDDMIDYMAENIIEAVK